MGYLTMEIGCFDYIAVGDSDMAYSCAGKVCCCWTAKTACAD
jgi:hypothetical protein